MQKAPDAAELMRLKRLAAQLFAQLPENREESLLVVTILRELVDWRPGMEATIEPLLKIVG